MSHLIRLCHLMSDGRRITASEVSFISNANQYFNTLEKMGISKSEWGYKGESKVKFRFIPFENIEKKNNFIKSHKKRGIK